MHVYPGNIKRLESDEPPHNLWFDVFDFAKKWGLEVSVLQNPGTTSARQSTSYSTNLSGTVAPRRANEIFSLQMRGR